MAVDKAGGSLQVLTQTLDIGRVYNNALGMSVLQEDLALCTLVASTGYQLFILKTLINAWCIHIQRKLALVIR